MDGFNRSTFLEDVKRHSVKHEDTEVAEERGVNDKITRNVFKIRDRFTVTV